MTGYESKRAAAQDKLKCQCSMTTKLVGSGCQYCNPEYMDDHSEDNLNMVAQPAQAEQCNYPDCKCPTENPCLKGLAQPAQEPVAWMNKHGACKSAVFREAEAGAKEEYNIPLYTNQTLEKNP